MFDCFDKRCTNRRHFVGTKKDKKALDNYGKNEKKRRHNGGKKSTNTSALTSPQACPTTTPLLKLASMLPTTTSDISLVTRSGRQATWLAQFESRSAFLLKSSSSLKSLES
jgi:hypothetical protein